MTLKAASSEIFLDWLPYLWAFGGRWFAPDGEPLFETPEGREALEFYCSLRRFVPQSTAQDGNESVAEALRERRVAFAVSWGGQGGEIYHRDTVVPSLLTTLSLTRPWNVAWSFAVLAKSPRPLDAVDLLSYLSSPKVDRLVGRYAGSSSRKSVYADPEERKRCPWYPAQEELLRRAVPLPAVPLLAHSWVRCTSASIDAFTERNTSPAALITAADACRRVLRNGS